MKSQIFLQQDASKLVKSGFSKLEVKEVSINMPLKSKEVEKPIAVEDC
jgi:hypothetical protein